MIPPSKSKPRIFPPKESYKGPITRSRIKTLEQNDSGALSSFRGKQCHTHNLLQVPIAELAERWTELPQVSEKLTVWCALWAGGIIGPYFFKNDEGHNVTVNGDRYRAMINNFFIPDFNNHDVQELWFQQDGATCHTPRATIDLLKDMFGDRLISRFGPVNWPPRSCNLTPLDYFLWGHVFEEMLYLQERIVIVSRKLDGKTYEKVPFRVPLSPTRANIRLHVNELR
ncbi:putative transposable element [Trichonephila clavipes]|nr:putative transposable element [Trichonephila clavipes]